MPYKKVYVDPEVFLTHRGTKVYNVYKDDDCENNPPREYWFTLDGRGGEDTAFDVRELKTWAPPEYPPFLCGEDATPANWAAWDKFRADNVEEKAVKTAILAALDSGELKPN